MFPRHFRRREDAQTLVDAVLKFKVLEKVPTFACLLSWECVSQIFMEILMVSVLWYIYFGKYFRCLAEKAGNVAFLKDSTVLQNTDGM